LNEVETDDRGTPAGECPAVSSEAAAQVEQPPATQQDAVALQMADDQPRLEGLESAVILLGPAARPGQTPQFGIVAQ